MNALGAYLAKHHYLPTRQLRHPSLDQDTTHLLEELVHRMDDAAIALAHANAVCLQLTQRLTGRPANVLLSSGQSNPTEARILRVNVEIRTGHSGGASYYITLTIELVHSKPYSRLRIRDIPLNQLVEVFDAPGQSKVE